MNQHVVDIYPFDRFFYDDTTRTLSISGSALARMTPYGKYALYKKTDFRSLAIKSNETSIVRIFLFQGLSAGCYILYNKTSNVTVHVYNH